MAAEGGYNGNNRIKADGWVHQFTKHELDEYVKCMNSVEYFCNNYVKVRSLDKGLVNFELRGYQRDMVRHLSDNRFSVILACRQSGKSITSVAWIMHFLIFNPDKKVGLLANKGALAREMLSRLTLMLENLPFFLQPGCRVVNKGSIYFSNGSGIIAAATSSSSIRGEALDIIFLDEFAFVQNDTVFYTSTYPVISSGQSTKVIITSTPNGIGNMFHKIWEGAVQNTSAGGFKPFKINWWDVPGRDEAWKAETIANTSQKQFDQEFGVQFQGSAQTLISTDTILGLQSRTPVKEQYGIKYFFEPVPGMEYVMTVDVGKGRGQDYSTFTVFEVGKTSFKQVCTYRDNMISPLLFPEYIVRAAKTYNTALVIIENNDTGQVVCNSVYYDYEYENVFVSSAVKSDGIGVMMTKKVKRIGCSNLKDLVESGRLALCDAETIVELSSFEPKGDSFSASNGNHDDMVMNLVMFAWFVSTSAFGGISTIDLKDLLYSEQIQAMEESLPPFGFLTSSEDSSPINPEAARIRAEQLAMMDEWRL